MTFDVLPREKKALMLFICPWQLLNCSKFMMTFKITFNVIQPGHPGEKSKIEEGSPVVYLLSWLWFNRSKTIMTFDALLRADS